MMTQAAEVRGSPAPDAVLVLRVAGRPGPAFRLDPAAENVLGRAAGAVVVLPDRLASRSHACLTYDRAADAWTLRDLGSRNGTWLDGVRIERAIVVPGGVIRIGTSELAFQRSVSLPPVSAEPGWRLVRSAAAGHVEAAALTHHPGQDAEAARSPLVLYQAAVRLLAAGSRPDVVCTTLELAAELCAASVFGWLRVHDDGATPESVVPPGHTLRDRLPRTALDIAVGQAQAVWFAPEDAAAGGAALEVVIAPILDAGRVPALLAAAAPPAVLGDVDFDLLVMLASLASAATAGAEEAPCAPARPEPDDERTVALGPGSAASADLSAAERRLANFVAETATLRIGDWERTLVIEALRRSAGSVPEAAAELGISRATLYRKLEAYGLSRGR